MIRKGIKTAFLCYGLIVIIFVMNCAFIKAEEKQIERIEAGYLLGDWVDCSQPLDKDYIFIRVYYEDGSSIEKQGVGTLYPYVLVPGCQTKIQVEYEGVQGDFFVWGKEEERENTPIEIVSASPIEPIKTSKPKKSVLSKVSYELVSSQKGIGIVSGNKKGKTVYGNKNICFTLGTNNIKKLEYQFVKKGKKKKNRWKTMRKNQVVLRKQGKYLLYIRFTTISGKKMIKHTNGFVLDKKAPHISGVKNNGTYDRKVTITYKDKLSGIKKATINGEKLNKKTTIKKNGAYKVEVMDKAKNKKSLKFTVNIPTPTPLPTIAPTDKPVEKPTFIPIEQITVCSSLRIRRGKTTKVSYQIIPTNATNQRVTFTSTNTQIATISANGRVKAIKEGMASIIIRSESDNKKYAICVIYVE